MRLLWILRLCRLLRELEVNTFNVTCEKYVCPRCCIIFWYLFIIIIVINVVSLLV